jgi:hypothetical protein
MPSLRRLAALSTALVFAGAGVSLAQNAPVHPPIAMHGTMPMPSDAGMSAAMTRMPTLPGQEAFGTIQEIVGILEADPRTDWSKVDLAGLREHLIDMDELTMRARDVSTRIPGGLRIAVTGVTRRTVAAIQRMVPAHAAMINGHNGWQVSAKLAPNGALLTATANNPKEVAHIRGLGFIGLMATGAHHQLHHLAIAEGKHPMHMY